MSAPRSRRRRAVLLGLLGAVAALAVSLQLGGGRESGETRPLERRAAPREVPATELDEPALAPRDEPSQPEALAPHVAGEGAPSDAASVASAPLALVVRHAHGPPAAGARVGVQLAESQPWLAAGVLDDAGRVRFAGVDGAVQVVVHGATWEPARFELDVGRGEHELELPAGGVLAGRVLVDGAPPGAPFPVGLRGLKGPSQALDGAVRFPALARPGHVEAVYADGGFTDAQGRFVFSGLPLDEDLTLRWPRLHRLVATESTAQPVRAPRHDVLLSLRAPKHVRGRAVHADGSPATDAELRAIVQARALEDWRAPPPPPLPPNTTHARPSSVTSSAEEHSLDADARFAVAVGDLLIAQGRAISVEEYASDLEHLQLDLDLTLTCEHGRAVRELSDLDLTRDHELGDLVLSPPPRALLRVVDPAGAPLTEAKLRVELAEGRPPVHGVDAEGRVDFAPPAGALGVVTVLAPGFESARVTPLLAVEPEEQQVVLRPAASLELRFHGPWQPGEDREDWNVEAGVTAKGGSPFQDATHPAVEGLDHEWGWDELREVFHDDGSGRRQYYGSHISDGFVRVFVDTRGDSVRFEALRAHQPITARIRVGHATEPGGSKVHREVWERDIWLEPGEQRVLDVDLTALPPAR